MVVEVSQDRGLDVKARMQKLIKEESEGKEVTLVVEREDINSQVPEAPTSSV